MIKIKITGPETSFLDRNTVFVTGSGTNVQTVKNGLKFYGTIHVHPYILNFYNLNRLRNKTLDFSFGPSLSMPVGSSIKCLGSFYLHLKNSYVFTLDNCDFRPFRP